MNTQRLWGWQVAVHLFLVSVGAGVYLSGILLELLHTGKEFIFASKIAIGAAAPLVIAGAVFIFIHLGYKLNVLKAFLKPSCSWLARGSIILLVFIILDLVHIVLVLPGSSPQDLSGFHLTVSIIASLFALLTLIYSGMLLKTIKSFAFWNTWLVLILFVVSGISTGLMSLAFIMSVYNLLGGIALENPVMAIVFWNTIVILIQITILGLFLRRSYSCPAARNSFFILARGSNALIFWLGVGGAGSVVPLAMGVYLACLLGPVQAAQHVLVVAATSLGLFGGFLLRYTVLRSGTDIPLAIDGNMVPLPDHTRIPASQRVHYTAR